MQIAQLFFHNSILIASRTIDFWCFLKELAGLNRILIGFCDLFRKILLKREKTARIIQKAAYKNRQHDFFRLPVLGMFEPSKTFFHVSVCDTSESSANAAQFRLRCQNRQESIRKLHKNRQHDSFACLFWGCLSHQRRFSCFCLWCQWIECQRCTVPIKMPKSTRINQKTAQKQAARFLSPACFGDVWAVKGFFHVSFYDASESSRQPLQSKSECQRPTLSSSSCLPISCCPSSPSMPSPEIGQSLSGKTTAAAESSY